ncbi:MAG: hypothetical protein LBO72_09030 [Helicobacteraceae bacterium]|nr:hypothetical protein [Helicobacteraceae bacterium]
MRNAKPYSNKGKRVYEAELEGSGGHDTRFKVIIGDMIVKGEKTADERVISFYSDRKPLKGALLGSDKPTLPRAITSTSSGSETIAKSGAKVKDGKTLKSYAPYVAPPIAALFGLDDDLGDNSRPISLDLVIGQSNRFRDYRAEWQEGSGQTRKERARPLHRKRLLWE